MPGGVVAPIGDRAVSEISRRWPRLSLDRLGSDWAEYQILTQSPPAKPKAIRESLEKVVSLSSELRVCLMTLSEEAENHLWDVLCQFGQHSLLREMPSHLTLIQRAAMAGYNEELGRDGRHFRGANHRLFSLLRYTLEQAGYSERLNGDIARLAEILLDDAQMERPRDLPRAVREAFEGGGDRSFES
jgi:hypothetical protein